MTKQTEAVLADALRLRREERAEVASELLASLDGPTDPDAQTAWEAEIRAASRRSTPAPWRSSPGRV